jgi:RNA polymerase sigma-70 factor (ECF subfamily)
MAEEPPFRDLVRRVRAGDARAAAELVRLYEPSIRTVVRCRLAGPALRRLLDSADICQSVLASFFVRAAAGQYELDTPQQLLKLLATMARNKLVEQVLKQRAARRQLPGGPRDEVDVREVVDPAPDPGQVAAHRELLHEFRRRLSEQERHLADRRALGRSWAEIAAEVGGHADALRMQLSRAVERVSQELGLGA